MVVTELVAHGGLEARDGKGQSPLHTAAYHGETECVEILCSNSVDILARLEIYL